MTITTKRKTAVAEAVDQLATAMRRLHGGKWATAVDHSLRFILIREVMKPRRTKRSARTGGGR